MTITSAERKTPLSSGPKYVWIRAGHYGTESPLYIPKFDTLILCQTIEKYIENFPVGHEFTEPFLCMVKEDEEATRDIIDKIFFTPEPPAIIKYQILAERKIHIIPNPLINDMPT